MLKHMRQMLAREHWLPAPRPQTKDTAWWHQPLAVGSLLQFSLTPVVEFSGKQLVVTAAKEYTFGDVALTSLALHSAAKPVCSLIVSRQPGSAPYLAISRLLSEHDLQKLFAPEDLARLKNPSAVKTLFVREQIPGLKEWVVMRYERRMEDVEGKMKDETGVHKLRYALYASEQHNHAFEIEQYADGTAAMYATLYRPVSDVRQVTPPVEPAPLRPEPRITSPQLQEKEAAPVAVPLKTKTAKRAPEKTVAAAQEKKEETVATPAPEPRKLAQTPEAAVENALLACELHVAVRLIEEALRNDIRLSDMLRKILGLPVAIGEAVHFTLPLSEQDYRVLSQRYGLAAEDREAVKSHILDELAAFTGAKKKAPAKKRAMSEPA